jgi:hypothetical protein
MGMSTAIPGRRRVDMCGPDVGAEGEGRPDALPEGVQGLSTQSGHCRIAPFGDVEGGDSRGRGITVFRPSYVAWKWLMGCSRGLRAGEEKNETLDQEKEV